MRTSTEGFLIDEEIDLQRRCALSQLAQRGFSIKLVNGLHSWISESGKASERMYLLLCSSSDGRAALVLWPCAVHIRPMRDGTESPAALPASDDVEAPELIFGRAPVGIGSRDEAAERSLRVERSEGVGDEARASGTFGAFDSLIAAVFSTQLSVRFLHLV